MRRILVASLLSSFALAAAAATPQPPANRAAVITAASRPVSTGVTGPQLTSPATIYVADDSVLSNYPSPAQMLLRVNLDAAGNTTRVQILRPVSPSVDAYVVDAVRRFRWRPAELDNRNIPVAVNLIVNLQQQAR